MSTTISTPAKVSKVAKAAKVNKTSEAKQAKPAKVVSEAKPAKVAPKVTKDDVKSSKLALRTECRTLAYALKIIGEIKDVNVLIASQAKRAKKYPEFYKAIEAGVKRTKSGNFSPSLTIEYLAKVTNGKA
jgi:hypothetical protein